MAKILIGKYEGTIYEEGDGYTGALALGTGPDGKRKRLKRKGRTKAQVKEKLVKAVDDLEKGIREERNHTVEKAVNALLTHLAKQDKSEATMKTYRGLADHHIIGRIGKVKLTDLTADDVEAWLDDCAESMTTQTLKIVHGLLRRSIRLAERRDKVGRNVALLVDTPRGKRPSRRSRSLSLAQATTLLQVAQDPRHRLGAYVILAIVSGLRTEELRALTWADVDLKEKVVYVLRSDRDGGDTKTKKSRRGIAVADMAVDALTALRKRQAAEKLAAGDLWQGHNLVFCRENGAPYTSDDVLRRFQSLTRTAGLGSNWVPRELRHTFVSIMSDQGVALEKISDLVGHSGTHTTQTVYRHELRPVITTGAEKMNAIFNGDKSRSA
ncbi:tyrosine-type recombinase/integrase [Actinomadura opuntiae]|uniref:tyrosine-type recombinase/integrase n=1 Tax=Actinomadura sp. OS1-43 TaxID=604315 RepID=UPI00255B296C|nr:site-specific integrase [Actinomadura sp. OS1-43]MDL4820150.1 tyrosine-type recombinase/integrase [Actinomadura sp. OS1-43]